MDGPRRSARSVRRLRTARRLIDDCRTHPARRNGRTLDSHGNRPAICRIDRPRCNAGRLARQFPRRTRKRMPGLSRRGNAPLLRSRSPCLGTEARLPAQPGDRPARNFLLARHRRSSRSACRARRFPPPTERCRCRLRPDASRQCRLLPASRRVPHLYRGGILARSALATISARSPTATHTAPHHIARRCGSLPDPAARCDGPRAGCRSPGAAARRGG